MEVGGAELLVTHHGLVGPTRGKGTLLHVKKLPSHKLAELLAFPGPARGKEAFALSRVVNA